MELLIKIMIYIHAATGGFALIAGFISIISKKGDNLHKKSGIFFFYTMLTSGVTAMIVAVIPNHQSPFLFAVGIFSTYFILTGYRAINFKNDNPNLTVDRWIAKGMIFTGILMILLPMILTSSINIVLTVFAIIGILISVKDLILYKNLNQLKKSWLKLHLSKMIGGYISATTAFIVVNNFFPSMYSWFVPSIIGGFIIAYWIKKIKTL